MEIDNVDNGVENVDNMMCPNCKMDIGKESHSEYVARKARETRERRRRGVSGGVRVSAVDGAGVGGRAVLDGGVGGDGGLLGGSSRGFLGMGYGMVELERPRMELIRCVHVKGGMRGREKAGMMLCVACYNEASRGEE